MSEASSSSPVLRRALYVYYRVALLQAAEAEAGIRALQSQLMARRPGLLARLLQRMEAQAPAEATWMEIYEHADGVSDACERDLAELVAALPQGLTGPRHVEVFGELPSAAR